MQIDSSLLISNIRKEIRLCRRSLPLKERLLAEQSIYQQIRNHPKINAAKNISIFISFDGELNTQPIIEFFWQQGKSVFLPVIHPFNKNHLLFLYYNKHSELKQNKLGIFTPKLDINHVLPYHQLDIILTPLVAFDDRNYRIGMGGGYYDRLLEGYQQKNIYPIGLAFKCQKIDQIPNQPWDVKLPEIIHD